MNICNCYFNGFKKLHQYGCKYYYIENSRKNKYDAIIIKYNGKKEWWLNGKKVFKEKQ